MAKNPLDNLKNFLSNPAKMFFPKKMLGIEVGTGSIKVAEISKWGQGKTLENYGQIQSLSLLKDSFKDRENGSYLLSNYFVSRAIRAILDEAKIKTKAAIFSVPDFSTFCTSFDLPPMSEKELPDAVYYSAPQYIPLPITETTLDWRVIGGNPGDNQSSIKIFLVAMPNQIVQDYQKVAQMAGLDLYAVESETLSLARSLVRGNKDCICMVDIGVQSTTISIVEKGNLRSSYSFDFAGGQLTYAIQNSLGVGRTEAEQIKNSEGLVTTKEDVSRILYLLIDPLLNEVKKVIYDFYQQEGKNIKYVYLTGGTSMLPGLKEYFAEILRTSVEIPNCFYSLLYPPILGPTLDQMAPSYSVAVGAALGGLEG